MKTSGAPEVAAVGRSTQAANKQLRIDFKFLEASQWVSRPLHHTYFVNLPIGYDCIRIDHHNLTIIMRTAAAPTRVACPFRTAMNLHLIKCIEEVFARINVFPAQ